MSGAVVRSEPPQRRFSVDAWRGVAGNLEEACATRESWAKVGVGLGRAARPVMWHIGEWWNLGERYGDRVRTAIKLRSGITGLRRPGRLG
jgi:hypothetical protein